MKNTNHFLTDGEVYDARRPTYTPSLSKTLSDLCNQTECALDVGCGTGQLSLLLANHFNTVVATDPSETQIENARQHSRITYRCETAEKIKSSDSSVDLITAAQAAHWFDLDSFYSEARRILRPNDVIALISYGVPRLSGPAENLFSHFYWQDIYSYWPSGRKHVEQGYQTLDFPFEEMAIEPMEIRRSWELHELLGYIDTWSSIKRARASGAQIIIEKFKNELSGLWGPSDETREIVWPIVGRVAYCNK